MIAWQAAQNSHSFSKTSKITNRWSFKSLLLFKSTLLSGSLIPRPQIAQNAIGLLTGGSEDTTAEFAVKSSVAIALKTVKSELMERSSESGYALNVSNYTRSYTQR